MSTTVTNRALNLAALKQALRHSLAPEQLSIDDLRFKTLDLTDDAGEFHVVLLDQTRLPLACEYVSINTVPQMVAAIKTMIVRGAPAIGIAGAYGMVLSVQTHLHQDHDARDAFVQAVQEDGEALKASRPTAVNLAWAVDQLLNIIQETDTDADTLLEVITRQALQIHQDDLNACYAMGQYGAKLIPTGAAILTHCNAGGLATAGYGTALGVIRAAYAGDPTITVYADETRPRLQGAKLTAWELMQDDIPVTLITDNMAGALMQAGKINAVVVGSDRIAANGDAANKIGTYSVACLAKHHNIPFYVAAPVSTIDYSLTHGGLIPIEERDSSEVSRPSGEGKTVPDGVTIFNPAFDVTPAELITAIITEKGVVSKNDDGSYVNGLKNFQG